MAETDIPIGENFMQRLVQTSDEEIEDWVIALQAAQTMSVRHQKDMAVLTNFRVVELENSEEPPLEIIRYNP